MKKFSLIVLLSFFMVNFMTVNAQITECEIVYDIDVSGADIEPMAKAMLNGATLGLSFKDKAARVDMKMGIMGSTIAITDDAKKEGVVLMNMMGQKMAIIMDEEQMKETMEQGKNADVNVTGKTKTIAGYKCKEAIVKDSEGNEMEIWYTDKIVPSNGSNQYAYSGIEGFPLEMEVLQDGMKMKMIAKKVNTDKMNDELFSTKVPKGYKVMSQEELQQMGQGR